MTRVPLKLALLFFCVPPLAARSVSATRPLTAVEILNVLGPALANDPTLPAAAITPRALQFDASLRVPLGDAHLHVRKVRYDAVLQRLVASLVADAAPDLLPFQVTLALPEAERPNLSIASGGIGTGPEPAVSPKRFATLVLHAPESTIVVTVRPLQAGRTGDTIRVRLPSSGRTFRARVVAPERLEADF